MRYMIRNNGFSFPIFSCVCLLLAGAVFSLTSHAETPKPELILALSNSLAKVYVVDQNGQNGIGSGVVVAPNRLATNCHARR